MLHLIPTNTPDGDPDAPHTQAPSSEGRAVRASSEAGVPLGQDPKDMIRTSPEARAVRPTIGRIVLFSPGPRLPDAHGVEVGGNEFVAIIGDVFDEQGNPRPCCNLLVMPPFATPYWQGGVREAHEGMRQTCSWRWPPRADSASVARTAPLPRVLGRPPGDERRA
ncbi:hypothetical protein [Rhodopila sp.]|uniref:hypothetical protein n=1 Tax=Rhodopila sp. TaxID=2480087 RepID=UPI003D0CAFCD